MLHVALNREYERESTQRHPTEPFDIWLRDRCTRLTEAEGAEQVEMRALSSAPSRKVCSFRSMTSYGSHYRVEAEEAEARHVTFDCGVAELRGSEENSNCSGAGGVVDIVRVGILNDIWVLSYVDFNLVLMVVSWVAKDTDSRPRLRRDPHGFWLANMAARPRCTESPYILPQLASQVQYPCTLNINPVCGYESLMHVSPHSDT